MSTKSRREIKQGALQSLQGKWVEFILVSILGYFLLYIGMLLGFVLLIIPGFVVASLGPFVYNHLALTVLDGRKPTVDDLFAFKGKVGRIFGAYMLMILIVLVGMIPLIIGGLLVNSEATLPTGIILMILGYLFIIYITIRLSYVTFILRDTDLTAVEAIKASASLTKGNVWRIIIFYLSFIGWILLATLTLGLLYFWLAPYMYVSFANLYRAIASENGFEINTPDYEEENLAELADY